MWSSQTFAPATVRNVPPKYEHLLMQQDASWFTLSMMFPFTLLLIRCLNSTYQGFKHFIFLISLLESSMCHKAVIWQQIPAAGKSFLQHDRFRSVSLTNFQIDAASLMITEDGKFPLHRSRGKEDLSYQIILPIHWPGPGRMLKQIHSGKGC